MIKVSTFKIFSVLAILVLGSIVGFYAIKSRHPNTKNIPSLPDPLVQISRKSNESPLVAVSEPSQADSHHQKNRSRLRKKNKRTLNIKKVAAPKGSINLAFTSLEHETEKPRQLTITGTIPAWLDGNLLRTGPALFEHKDGQAYALFDGCALLHRFSFNQGGITYQNHYLRSKYWHQVQEQGKFGMQTQAKGGLFSKLGSLLLKDSAPTYDNGASNICCIDGDFCAITETPLYHIFNPEDFSQHGYLEFDDKLSAHYSCAHLHQDQKTGDLYGYVTQFGNTSTYIPYKIKAHSKKRIPLAKINVGYPAYMHSFAYTDNYLIFIEPPLRVNPIDLILGDKSFLESYVWYPKQRTNILVLNKQTGKTVGKFDAPPFFYLHHINAYEHAGKILIDVPIYDDQTIASSFNLQPYREGKHPNIPKAIPTRLTIDIQDKRVGMCTLSNLSIETPHINYELVNGKPYTFVYGTHIPADQTVMTHLTKLNVTDGKALLWHEDSCYPGEPVFVPTPTGQAEDDGVLLSIVLDTRTGTSFLLILDAKNMKELGRAQVTHHIPLDSHGHFYKKNNPQ